MKFHLSAVILLGFLALVARAEPKPEPAKGRRSAYQSAKFRSPVSDDSIDKMIAELRQAEAADADDEKVVDEKTTPDKSDASSGRLFLKKFMLFKNIFSSSNSQPVIPIIITGAGSGTTATTNPTTTTFTSTGSIPTATGTITTSPTTTASRRSEVPEDDDDAGASEEAIALDEQTLQAALAAGAQEYVVTDEEIKGTSDGKASKQPARVNLKRKGDKKGQTISVRIPPKYRRYFKNGQRVMLNTGSRPTKKRVVRKRVNKNRKRVNRKKNSNIRKRIA